MKLPDDVGVEFDADTVEAPSSDSTPEQPQVDPEAVGPLDSGFERYRTRGRLGAGGMGEVLRCRDQRIGRDVAIKIVREVDGSAPPELRRRFEREARIQGQLEHPSIVPVYDLGRRPDGVAYFTMKRIGGMTLAAIIRGLRDRDPVVMEQFPRRRLLNAFGSACLAVAYANARGVIHRDLKPANIILGDFGEVYVLDWGVAKVVGEAAEIFFETEAAGPDQATQVGSLLGTPGYMAPEQVRGEADLDTRADVYALGMILYELLALERFHRGKTVEEILDATLTAGPARPLERAVEGDIPVELDDLCARATAPERRDRLATARDLHVLLERYLAGDRDAEQRHLVAEQHVANAEKTLATSGDDPERDIEVRTKAIRELIAALSLEPENIAAHQTMVRALTETSTHLPEDARAELAELRSQQRKRAARNATLGLGALYALLPLLLWNGVREHWAMGAMVALLTAATLVAFVISRTSRIPTWHYLGLMVILGGLVGATVTLFGPFFVTPALALAFSASLMAGARLAMRWRAAVIAIAVAAVLIPVAIQWQGGFWPYVITGDGALKVVPTAIDFSSGRTMLVLLTMTVAGILLPSMLIGRSVDVLHRAEERLFAQAWRLRRIFPDQVDQSLVRREG